MNLSKLTSKSVSTLARLKSRIRKLERDSQLGSGQSAFCLALIMTPNNTVVPDHLKSAIEVTSAELNKYYQNAFGLLKKESESGSGESMHLLALFYQGFMPGAPIQIEKFVEWCERSFASGYTFAANDLYSIYSEPSSKYFDPVRAQTILGVLEKEKIRVVCTGPAKDHSTVMP